MYIPVLERNFFAIFETNKNEMIPDTVCLYYTELRKVYTLPGRTWAEKALPFRSLLEGFFKALTPEMNTVENPSLFKRIDCYYDIHPEQENLRTIAHKLRKSLNRIHDTVTISEDGVKHLSLTEKDFLDYYARFVSIISKATGVSPDNKTLELLGVLKDNSLDGLNVQQKDAVLSESRIVYVNAGPGTGKTKLLVNKLVHLIKKTQGLPKIVALSYTNTASGELSSRFREEAIKAGLTMPCDLYTGTIHSFCLSSMRGYFKSINKEFAYSLIADEELIDLLPDLQTALGNRYPVDELVKYLSANNKASMPSEVNAAIETMKKSMGVILISDILKLFVSNLNNDHAFVNWAINHADYILVDEAQDLSNEHYEIFRFFLNNKPSLRMFFVGDPRQNIFAFNGGSFKHLDSFLSEYKDEVDEKTLTETYRCPSRIAAFVNKFKFIDCNILPITCVSNKEGDLRVTSFDNQLNEAEYIVNRIISDTSLDDSVVISPTIKGLAPIISALNEKKIPFKVYGGSKRLRKHIRLLNHMLRIITSNYEKSIKVVAKELGVDVMTQPIRAPRHFSPKELFIRTSLGRQFKQLSIDYGEGNLSTIDLVSVLYNELFPKEMIEDKQCQLDFNRIFAMIPAYKSIQDYLTAFSIDKERFSSFYDKDYVDCESQEYDSSLVLSTIHSSKGLQWKHVYIVGLYDEAFPGLQKARFSSPDSRERYLNTRLKELYVACTRAIDEVEITYPLMVDEKSVHPSSFVINYIDRAE